MATRRGAKVAARRAAMRTVVIVVLAREWEHAMQVIACSACTDLGQNPTGGNAFCFTAQYTLQHSTQDSGYQ
ncbi:MAG: hypothetical protein HYV60_09035 [Planctomycetia bacterium]|nr:hypothetical protein [Planctomycetia bacterium]